MKKFFKWFGIVLGSLLSLILLLFLGLAFKGNSMLNKKYNVKVEQIAIPTDTDSITRGEHWVKVECTGCHGEDLTGANVFEAPFAYVDAKNLTSGKGGIGATFTDEDWIRALRHGVNPEGHSLMVMPSYNFRYYSDEDLGEIIAYMKTIPPVDKEMREPTFNWLGKALLAQGAFGNSVVVAEYIAQNQPAQVSYPPAGVTTEYGKYLVDVSGCHDCHGLTLSGGKNADPEAKNAPNLTPGGELVVWNENDFIKAIRTGVALSGHQLDPEEMPWKHFRYFSDDELKAIFKYLQSLPKLQTTVP